MLVRSPADCTSTVLDSHDRSVREDTIPLLCVKALRICQGVAEMLRHCGERRFQPRFFHPRRTFFSCNPDVTWKQAFLKMDAVFVALLTMVRML